MTKAQRGMATAAGMRGSERAAMIPPMVGRVPMSPSRKKIESEGGPWVYLCTGLNAGRSHGILITGDPDVPGDEALTKTVLIHHPGGWIDFVDYHFETHHLSVKQWMDRRIKTGRVKGVYPDSQAMRMRCTYCDHTEYMTSIGSAKMADHIMRQHGNDDDLGFDDGDFTMFGDAAEHAAALVAAGDTVAMAAIQLANDEAEGSEYDAAAAAVAHAADDPDVEASGEESSA